MTNHDLKKLSELYILYVLPYFVLTWALSGNSIIDSFHMYA